MRTKVEQDFLDKLEKYILTMGKMIDFTKQHSITKEFFGKYLVSSFLDTLPRNEFLNIWLDDISVLEISLDSYERVDNCKEFIQKDLVSKYSFFAYQTISLHGVTHD